MKRWVSFRAVVVVLALIPLAAMDDCERFLDPFLPPAGPVCTEIAVPSVVLDLRDEDNRPLPDAVIRFTSAGRPVQTVFCDGDCDEVVLVYEVVGRIDFAVSSIGFATVIDAVNVPIDSAGCHPVTQERTVVLHDDPSAALLAGAWETQNAFGRSIIRFGDEGEIIGAMLFDRVVAGDGNVYIAYNGHSITGAAGQEVLAATADEPVRNGDLFTFATRTMGFPIGFEDAVMSFDLGALAGSLESRPVTYVRLDEIPPELK